MSASPTRVPAGVPVTDLVLEVADLHHRVYRLTDGEDADWPIWYATWLVERSELPQLLGSAPVRSELVCLLVLLDREVAAGGVTEPWDELYARRIAEQFAA